jgi:hypothetical protein
MDQPAKSGPSRCTRTGKHGGRKAGKILRFRLQGLHQAKMTDPMPKTSDLPPGLPARFLEAAMAHGGRALPPVERWNPADCGDIDMRIARDGQWFYMGTPIARPALVKLFSTILRNDAGRHVLVTPVERVGIIVEDAPFLAVEMADIQGPDGPSLAFRTNLDEIVIVDAAHPLRFTLEPGGGLKPYLLVRGDLWARLTRALALDLADRLVERSDGVIGLSLGTLFFPVPMPGEAGHA